MQIEDFSYYTVPLKKIKKHQKFILYAINNLSNILGYNNAVKIVMQSAIIEILMYDWRYVYHYDISYWCDEIMKYPVVE